MDIGACICICLYSDEYRIIMTHQCWRLLSILVACGWMPSLIGLSVIMSKIRICIKGEKMPHGASWPTLAAVPSSCSSKRSSPWLLAYFLIFWDWYVDVGVESIFLSKNWKFRLRAQCLGPLCFGNVYATQVCHDFELALKSW